MWPRLHQFLVALPGSGYTRMMNLAMIGSLVWEKKVWRTDGRTNKHKNSPQILERLFHLILKLFSSTKVWHDMIGMMFWIFRQNHYEPWQLMFKINLMKKQIIKSKRSDIIPLILAMMNSPKSGAGPYSPMSMDSSSPSPISGQGITDQDCTEVDVHTYHVTLTYKPRIWTPPRLPPSLPTTYHNVDQQCFNVIKIPSVNFKTLPSDSWSNDTLIRLSTTSSRLSRKSYLLKSFPVILLFIII